MNAKQFVKVINKYGEVEMVTQYKPDYRFVLVGENKVDSYKDGVLEYHNLPILEMFFIYHRILRFLKTGRSKKKRGKNNGWNRMNFSNKKGE